MQYLTLEQIKKQCNIDAAFEDDDNLKTAMIIIFNEDLR